MRLFGIRKSCWIQYVYYAVVKKNRYFLFVESLMRKQMMDVICRRSRSS